MTGGNVMITEQEYKDLVSRLMLSESMILDKIKAKMLELSSDTKLKDETDTLLKEKLQ